jgi:cyclopropane-fatty-acyl-phospholipid synthase
VDRAAERQLVLNPALALGELYMDSRLVVTRGCIYDVLALISSNLAWTEPHGIAKAMTRLRSKLRPISQRNNQRRAKHNVAHHYDLDGRLYELFLDDDRQYSCAYFERPSQSLNDAQLSKKRHIAAKLLVEPGHRVLDIGCGWGGLALYLADLCCAEVTGVTLSEEQLAIAAARAQERGLAEHVNFRLQDYRAVMETFDRIVSVGMFEHVGVGYYGAFFDKAAQLLSDDGVILLHSIGRMDGPGATNPWMEKYIFPGGYAPSLSEVLPAIERAGLIITDIEILRLHYAETLRAWREHFLARREEAQALYDERFCRMWEFYLAACECAFRHSGLMVFQIQLAKRLDAVPLTRDYIGQNEAELRTKERSQSIPMMAAE